jgi:hypothetical protein
MKKMKVMMMCLCPPKPKDLILPISGSFHPHHYIIIIAGHSSAKLGERNIKE